MKNCRWAIWTAIAAVVLVALFGAASIVMFNSQSGPVIDAWNAMTIPQTEFSQAQHSPQDREAIEQLYATMRNGWAEGDAEKFASPFAEESDFIAFDGTHLRGRAAIVGLHAPLFQHTLAGSKAPGRIEHIHFVTPDVAVLHTRGAIVEEGNKEAEVSRDSVQTMVAVKKTERWEFVAFHNNRVRPMGRHFGSTMLWLMFDGLWNMFGYDSP